MKMKTKKKPDLLIRLTIFVGLGVVISSHLQFTPVENEAGQAVASHKSNDYHMPQTKLVLYKGSFVKVATIEQKDHTSKEADDEKAN